MLSLLQFIFLSVWKNSMIFSQTSQPLSHLHTHLVFCYQKTNLWGIILWWSCSNIFYDFLLPNCNIEIDITEFGSTCFTLYMYLYRSIKLDNSFFLKNAPHYSYFVHNAFLFPFNKLSKPLSLNITYSSTTVSNIQIHYSNKMFSILNHYLYTSISIHQ